jgi:hypothetical protein
VAVFPVLPALEGAIVHTKPAARTFFSIDRHDSPVDVLRPDDVSQLIQVHGMFLSKSVLDLVAPVGPAKHPCCRRAPNGKLSISELGWRSGRRCVSAIMVEDPRQGRRALHGAPHRVIEVDSKAEKE